MAPLDPLPTDRSNSESPPPDRASPEAGGRLWPWALAAGLIAGLVAGMSGEFSYHAIKPVVRPPSSPLSGQVRWSKDGWVLGTNLPDNFESLSAYAKSAAIADAAREGSIRAERINSAIAYGVLGAVLAACLGLAGGLAGRSIARGLVAAAIGLVAGAAAGAGMIVALTPLFYRLLEPEANPLAAPVVTHALLFGAIGLVAGLALGIGWRRATVRAIAGGVVGALVATMIIEASIALIYPLLRVLEPIPGEAAPRVATYVIVSVFVALCAAIAVRDPDRRPAAPPLAA